MIEIFIPAKPHPKQRPRFSSGHVYTSEQTKKYEKMIGFFVSREMIKNQVLISEKAIKMKLVFSFLPSKSNKVISRIFTKKPDIDNLVKSILDGLNGVAYKDDKQIFSIACEKVYSEEEGVYIKMEEIDDVVS